MVMNWWPVLSSRGLSPGAIEDLACRGADVIDSCRGSKLSRRDAMKVWRVQCQFRCHLCHMIGAQNYVAHHQ
ncbi:hypothetical protein TNCV_557361 [Trichonephila clavipes]|uniref:Uncharacterized protein n=1 Tax=Trichonephila clavipes TaxID=2585209 RepID=A0A8X6UY52_TRICX|nr:hypothetical protein TNCV_557361 [Trichonephila clavipes]